MKQLIFAVILFATLSMVNAVPLRKRGTVFGICPLPSQPELIQKVVITPDPLVPDQDLTFTISTTLSKDITTDDKLIIAFYDPDFNLLQDVSNFHIKNNVKSGQTFETTKTMDAPTDATVPPGYRIYVLITASTEPLDIMACAAANVGVSSTAIAESYPIA